MRKTVLSLVALLPPTFAHAVDPSALPTGGAVVNGAAAISQAGSRLSVQQQSAKAIVNWNTFNIGSQAAVNFQQPSTSSVVLNRVSAGGGVSEIYGSLTANGQVFLINPAGTIFGRGAQVNVGGLLASSLDITNDNFLGGNYRFNSGGSAGSILNQGSLTAADGGYIALLAPQVRNEGVVAAQLGTVALGAGNAVTLDMNGTGLVSMRVEQAAVDALIANKNLVQADGGVVIMSARAAGQLAGGVINNTGEIHAATVTERNGVIRLEAGDVANSGSIVADGASGGRVTLVADNTTINSGVISAQGSEGRGGEIRLLGDKVGLFGTGRLEASGDSGGGKVLVGGNYQGRGPEQNASVVYVGPNASIRADAGVAGNGGRVIVWSDDLTTFAGTLQARGGEASGHGGFAEVSGRHSLDFSPRLVDLKAPNGSAGTLLLDPMNIIVATGGGAAYTDVSTFGAQSGTTQTIDPVTLNGVGASVTLQATNDITVTNAINLTTANAGLTAQAGNDIAVNASITTNNGAITLSARDPGTTPTPSGTVTLNAPLSSNGGPIVITNNASTAPINLGAAVSALGGAVTFSSQTVLTGNVTVSANGGINFANTLNGPFALTANSSGTTTFGGLVGNSLPLSSLATDAGGTTAINGGIVNTTGAQTYGDAVTLGAFTALTGVGITFFNSLDGAQSLTVNDSGPTTFSGVVGGTTPLSNLTTDAPGTTTINGFGQVKTSGFQSYGDPVTLGAATTLTGTGISFSNTLNGAQTLTINDSGTTFLNGQVGNATPLTSLTTDAPGATSINGGSVTTTGAQNYGDGLALGAATTFTVTSPSQSITFNNNVSAGANNVTLNAGGVLTELGSGAVTTTGTLTTTSVGGQLLNGGNSVGTFNATNSGSGNILFMSIGNLNVTGISQSGGGNITLNSGGPLTIGSNVTAGGSGSINLNVGSGSLLSHTAGAISSTSGAITLSADKMALSGGTISTGAGGVQLSPSTTGNLINLGSTSDAAANTLELSNAELGTVNTSGALKIGSGLAGQIIISNPLALGAVAPTLVLNSGSTIGEGPGGQIGAGTLTTSSVGGQTFTGANTVGAFGPANSGSGSISLTNTAPTLAINAIAQSAPSGSVTISNAGNLAVTGSITGAGGAVTLAANGASSDLLVGAGISGNAGNITLTAGRDVVHTNGTTATFGILNETAGRDLKVLGGTISAVLSAGTMNLTAPNDLRIVAGTGTGTSAQAFASNIQNVNANTVTLIGGSAGSSNLARLASNGSQTIAAASGISITGGSSGGGFGTGNSAQISSAGNQNISVGSGGLTLTGGGGALTDNFASLIQSATAAVGGSGQSITVNGGGSISLTGGSSAQSGIGTASGHGSFAAITTDGVSQQINFTAGGAINLTGGTVGSRNSASIQSRNGGAQTITGSPSILITGGASGGLDLESNNAGIFVDNNGPQTITAGNVTLNAGAGGISNAAFIQALTQNITVHGNLAENGGGSTPGAVNGGGAAVGGRGGSSATPTNLTLTVDGDITLNGGSVASAGAAIGSGNLGGQPTDMTINAGGNVTLNPGSASGARIGSPVSSPAGGNIAVTAGGAIALNDSATQGTGILTQGNLTLQAASISGGTFGKSGIGANALATTSTAGATSLANLAVGSLSATSTGGALNLGNGTVTGNLVANSNGNAIAENGALIVGGTANLSAGAAPITLTAANDFQGVVTLSNSGANAVQITDINTIQFANLALGGNFTVNAPTIIGHDTTNTGNQTWNGNATFNSTETTNGGSFTVTGTTTLGNNVTINSGAGNVLFAGIVSGTTAGGQFLVVNSTGTTAFGGSIGTLLIPIASLTTDAGGATTFNGNVFTGAAGTSAITPTIVLGDPASGTGTLNSTGGLILVSDISSTLSLGTTGSIVFTGTGPVGSSASPLVFTQTPLNLQTINPISLTFAAPSQPTGLIFAPGSSIFAFLGGSASAVILAANASPLVSQVTSVPAQSAQAVATIAPDASSASPTSSTSPTSSASPATAAALPASGTASAPTAVAAPEAGTVRPTASSGVSKETIRQIDQQISQARTQLFSPALNQLTRDPTIADVPECGSTGQGVCVKEGKKKKSTLLAESDPVIKRRVALLFGNDRYLAPIPALETPIHDVEDIGKVLQDRLGYETRVVRNATKEQIVDELNRLVTEVDDEDSVFVYYAGHGYQAEKGGGGYWIPVDATNNDASGWISNSAISKFLANMASRQVMLVSDSCYSGTLAQEQKVTSSESTVFDRKEILRKRSVLVMSSGGNEPVADGGHDNHSLFAYHMLRSLNEVQGDLVGGDIHGRVRSAVMKEYPQDPQYGAVVSAGHAQGGEYLIEKK